MMPVFKTVLVYGSGAMKVENLATVARLRRGERMMVRRMCEVSFIG